MQGMGGAPIVLKNKARVDDGQWPMKAVVWQARLDSCADSATGPDRSPPPPAPSANRS